jgi:peptidyl-tRNA hydrolase, PTH1 family
MEEHKYDIKAIIGLGNPGSKYYNTRHNIGFRILDALALAHNAYWQEKDNMLLTNVHHEGRTILLIKPQTFMNSSGKVIPFLLKKGIKPENILVVHDEIELPFGKIKVRFGGSAKGHNGLRSIIDIIGKDFIRLRFGVDRPRTSQEVPDYVLAPFTDRPEQVDLHIGEAVAKIGELVD